MEMKLVLVRPLANRYLAKVKLKDTKAKLIDVLESSEKINHNLNLAHGLRPEMFRENNLVREKNPVRESSPVCEKKLVREKKLVHEKKLV